MISAYAIPSGGAAASYHDKAFAQDGASKTADNYYINEAAPATWQGKGAAILGIKNTAVKREDFINFLDGKIKNPANGQIQDLAENSRGTDRRAGWDFTISAPKSVSIVGLVGGDQRVIDAHIRANAAAMTWIEEHASLIRVKDALGRNVKEQAGNLMWATVQHETSRANEPQLHNHNVIAAVVYDTKRKKWRSLTNDALLKLRADGDSIYKGVLAKGLREAGYEINYSKNGRDFEIAGLMPEQVETYSTRSSQIDEALRKRGYDPETASWAARQAATLDTRAKKNELPRAVLHEVWQEKAKEAALDLEDIVAQSKERAAGFSAQSIAQTKMADSKAALAAVSWAVAHLSEREQSFTVPALEAAAVKFARGDIADIKAAIASHIKNDLIIDRKQIQSGAQWLTTHKGISSEMGLRENILAGKGHGRAVLTSTKEFQNEVKSFEAKKTAETGEKFKLSDEQVHAAKNILMHEDQYQGIQGEAGTGKTAALAMVRDVAAKKGWQVIGIATAASAARELGASSGIESRTLASFFVERENALRAARLEITALKAACEARGLLKNKDAPRIESKRLHVKSFDLNFGEHRYTFDHERGEVFKLGGSLSNILGGYLLDASTHLHSKISADLAKETLGGRLRAGITGRAAALAQSLGNTLSCYEKVALVEAIAARNALYRSRDDETTRLTSQLNSKEAELENLLKTGNKEGRQTLLVMDESSMTGAYDAEKIAILAKEIGARVVFQGDTKQHGSVPAGRAFEQAQWAGMNVSILEETRRFDKATPQTKAAIAELKLGNYPQALKKLDHMIVEENALANTTAVRYLENLEDLKLSGKAEPKVGVVVSTNKDRKAINASIHDLLQEKHRIGQQNFNKEHLDDPTLTPAECRHVAELAAKGVNRLIFSSAYKELGISRNAVLTVTGFDIPKNRVHATTASGKKISINPDKQTDFSPARLEHRDYAVGDKIEARENILPQSRQRVTNGTRGTILAIDDKSATIAWQDGSKSTLGNKEMCFVDLAYAHTTFKEQGATNDREIIAVSKMGAKVFHKQAVYVATTRAKDNTEIVTSDMKALLKSAGEGVLKTTAMDMKITGQEAFDRAITKALGEKAITLDHTSKIDTLKQSIGQHKTPMSQEIKQNKEMTMEMLLRG